MSAGATAARTKYLIKDPDHAAVIATAHDAMNKSVEAMVRSNAFRAPAPLDLDPVTMDQAAALLEKYTAPAGVMAARKRVHQLREALGARRQSDEANEIFARVIKDLPQDLLDEGLYRVLNTRTYKAMPAPAEYLEKVKPALGIRITLLRALQRDIQRSAPAPEAQAQG